MTAMEKRLGLVIGDLSQTSAMVDQIERTAKAMHKAAIPGICVIGNWDSTHRLYKLAMCQLANAAIESLEANAALAEKEPE